MQEVQPELQSLVQAIWAIAVPLHVWHCFWKDVDPPETALMQVHPSLVVTAPVVVLVDVCVPEHVPPWKSSYVNEPDHALEVKEGGDGEGGGGGGDDDAGAKQLYSQKPPPLLAWMPPSVYPAGTRIGVYPPVHVAGSDQPHVVCPMLASHAQQSLPPLEQRESSPPDKTQ